MIKILVWFFLQEIRYRFEESFFGVKRRSQERTSQDRPLSKVICVVLSFFSAYLLKQSSGKTLYLQVKMQMVLRGSGIDFPCNILD